MKSFAQARASELLGVRRLLEGRLTTTCIVLFGLLCTGAGVPGEQRDGNQLEIIWRHAVDTGPLPLGCRGTPALGSDGSIYVPAGNLLYALNPDGSEKWSLGENRGLASLGDVAIDDKDTIYAGSDALCAFAPDGSLKWKILGLGGSQLSSIAIGEDKTIYFMRRNKLCAASAEGVVKWERETGVLNNFAPVIGSDREIYSQGFQGGPGMATIHAFNSDGALKRIFNTKGKMFVPAQPAVDDLGNLYFGALGGDFYALDGNAQLKWIFETKSNVASAPAIGTDRTIYFGCADGNLYAVNPNGELKWKFHTNGPIGAAPAIDSEGNIYFASHDRNFYCLDSKGTQKAVLPVTAGFGSPVIGIDGTIYLVDVGYVYAIRGFAPPSAGPWPMKRHDAQGTGRVASRDANAAVADAEK